MAHTVYEADPEKDGDVKKADVAAGGMQDAPVVPTDQSMISIEVSEMSEGSKTKASRSFHVAARVRIGGVVLSLCAGMVNSVAFYELQSFVSHTTGTLSKAGIGLEDGSTIDASDPLLLLASFVCGSTLCGLLLGQGAAIAGLALYDFCLLGVSSLLIATTATSEYEVARYFASAACGLQNGMATTWGGAVIRTTHVTGLFTDVGLLLGRLLSIAFQKRCGMAFDEVDCMQVADDFSKLSVLATLGVGYFVGVICGAYFFNFALERAFLIPAAITGTLGLAFLVYRVMVLGQRVCGSSDTESDDEPEPGDARKSPHGGTAYQFARMTSPGTSQDIHSGSSSPSDLAPKPQQVPPLAPGGAGCGTPMSSKSIRDPWGLKILSPMSGSSCIGV